MRFPLNLCDQQDGNSTVHLLPLRPSSFQNHRALPASHSRRRFQQECRKVFEQLVHAVWGRDGPDVSIRAHHYDRADVFVDSVRIKSAPAIVPLHVDIIQENSVGHDMSSIIMCSSGRSTHLDQ